MSKLELSIPHQLDKEQAVSRIKNLLANLATEHAGTISNVKEEWNGSQGDFAFSAKGFDLAGKINVNDNDVQIDADLPFAVSLFSGAIKRIIQERAQELLR